MTKKKADSSTNPASPEEVKNEAVDVLRAQHNFIDSNFEKLMKAADGDSAKITQLKRAYLVSYDQFWEAVARTFAANQPIVKQLSVDMAAAQKDIKAELDNLKDVAKVFQLLTSIIGMAASLLMLASA
ncbi:MAG: hypothetical protein AB7E72_09695 [Lysobacterales bacterium]